MDTSSIFDSLLLDAAILVVFLLLVTYIYFKLCYTYWKKHNVPYIEPSFPLGNFGDQLLFKKQIGFVIMDLYKKLEGKKYGGTYVMTKPRFIFRDPDLIKNALIKDFPHFHDRGFYFDEEVEPLSSQLFLLAGTRWRNLRIKLTPTFTSGKMKMMFDTLVECGEELRNCLQEAAIKEEMIEMKDMLARYSTDIIASCAFGIQCNCLKNPDAEFRQWGRKIFKPTLKTSLVGILALLMPALLPIFRLSPFDPHVSKYFRKMVKETIEYRENNNVRRNDFLQLLIQLKNKGSVDLDDETKVESSHGALENSASSKNEFSFDLLAAQAFIFFAAGFETSSTTMTFCLYELSLNPDIQDRVRADVRSVMEKHNGKITYESINEMNYLDKVVSETLRKYPPVAILNRACTKEYTIPGTDVVIKEGIGTIIPVLALHHDPKYYPDPERFDPERFSEQEKEKRHPFVYLPFGEGPRICIGMRFGLMQTKVGLASLLSKYQFSVSEQTPIPLDFDKKSFILSPVGGMWLKIKQCR